MSKSKEVFCVSCFQYEVYGYSKLPHDCGTPIPDRRKQTKDVLHTGNPLKTKVYEKQNRTRWLEKGN